MGFIRGGLLVIASIFLLISLIIGNLLLTFTLSLDYENVKPELVSLVRDFIEGEFDLVEGEVNLTEEMGESLEFMEEYCQNNTEYVLSYEGNTFVIPCDVVEQGPEAVAEQGIESLVERQYYQDFECDFWDCLEKTGSPLFLISQKAHDYWKSRFYIAFAISIVLIVLMFFLVVHKQNLPIIVGSLLIVSSLPFMKLEAFSSLLGETISQFLILFISKAHTVFWWTLIPGIVILGAGIGLHFVNLGNFVAEKLKKTSKKVKEAEKIPPNKK